MDFCNIIWKGMTISWYLKYTQVLFVNIFVK